MGPKRNSRLQRSTGSVGTVSRSYSDKFIPGMSDFDLFKNRNVDWMSGPFTKLCYVIFVFLVWGFTHLCGTSTHSLTPEEAWTVTNVVHGVMTFFFFHWIKGCPDDSTQGEYNSLTLYEQIDAGVPWTSTKKFLMLMPTCLCGIACSINNYKSLHVIINCSIFLVVILAKIPEMHRVRIFGINSGT